MKDVRAQRGMMWVVVAAGGGAGVVVDVLLLRLAVRVVVMARREVSGQMVKTVPSMVEGVVVWTRILSNESLGQWTLMMSSLNTNRVSDILGVQSCL